MISIIKLIVISILVILFLISFVSVVHASNDLADDSPSNRLPFCNEHETQHKDRSVGLLYVSTLDGKVSALDIMGDGETKWTLNTIPGQMISSSIHDIELTNNGKLVRMIPSLSGSIYKFDGDSVEPIPINADNLLSTTFKYSDELVISGGRETISYGVSANSGRVIYECSMRGCFNNTDLESGNGEGNNEIPSYDDGQEASTVDDEVIIVRRQTQTVRAIEPRTGEERWNFSVGHHELESINSHSDCHASSKKRTDIHELMKDVELKVIVPEGLICAVRKNAPQTILWKTKFDHPIVNVWRRDENNQLKMIDLFRTAHEMWQFQGNSWTQTKEASIRKENVDGAQMPSIYVGMYKRQLYIQESDHLRSIRMKLVDHIMGDIEYGDEVARIPWRPIEASSSSLLQIEFDELNENPLASTETSEVALVNQRDHSDTATSILHGSEYVNGNGFYLYSESKGETICDRERDSGSVAGIQSNTINETTRDDIDDYRTTPMINVVSMWYWWREISLIALSAFIFNFLLTKKPPGPEVVIVERHVEIKVPATPEPVDSDYLLPAIEYQPKRNLSESNGSDGLDTFHSRFQTDFNMLECLGKGGFGVVFEAKNLIDDCNYAIKRIVLPKNKQSRERVMREVKTLANCEHQNIVRYFQAWVESPPPGWQEKEDNIWMDRYGLSSHLVDIDSPTSEEPSHPFHPNKSSPAVTKQVRSQAYNKNKLDFLIAGLQTNECVNFDDDVRKTNFGNNDDADDSDDSFIVFANDDNEEKSGTTTNNMDESDTSSDDEKSKDNNNVDLSNSVFNPLGASSGTKNRISCVNNSIANCPASLRGSSKQRSFSMNECSVAAKDKNCEISINLSDDECDIESEHNRKKRKSPFKPTHRRPLSLDLTSTGSVQIPAVNATKSLSYLYIQMQLCRKESLKDWLVQNGTNVRVLESHNIFRQIVEAVEYVHLKGLIHRDLKPSNIFFSLDGRVKIGDFGLVTDMAENLKSITQCVDPSCAKHTQQVGTHLYMSPEQLQGRPYNYKVDIYSLGLILFELLMVFGTEMERIQTIKSLRSVKFPNGFQDEFEHEYKLLQMMLSKNPNERPTTYGIRARPPFSESTDEIYHFELPPRRRESQSFSGGFSSSSNHSSSSANLNSAPNKFSL